MSAELETPFLSRLAAAERRLVEHAARPLPTGLTDPDPGASERWEAGQVWAHLAEFPGYWLEQIRDLLAARAGLRLVTGDKRLLLDASMRSRVIAPHGLVTGD